MQIKIVSSNEGLRLLQRNRMNGYFDQIRIHDVYRGNIVEYRRQKNTTPIMQYHSSLCEVNHLAHLVRIAQPKPVPLYHSVIGNKPVYLVRTRWDTEKTLGQSLNHTVGLYALRASPSVRILLFAPAILCTVLYRILKQVMHTISEESEVVLVRGKLDKTVRHYFTDEDILHSLAQNSMFGGYNAKRVFKYNGVFIKSNIVVHNGKLTKNSCKVPIGENPSGEKDEKT